MKIGDNLISNIDRFILIAKQLISLIHSQSKFNNLN